MVKHVKYTDWISATILEEKFSVIVCNLLNMILQFYVNVCIYMFCLKSIFYLTTFVPTSAYPAIMGHNKRGTFSV